MVGERCPACGGRDILHEALSDVIRCSCRRCSNVWLERRLDAPKSSVAADERSRPEAAP